MRSLCLSKAIYPIREEQGMTNEKAFQIVAVDMLGNVEVVANFIDYGLAEETLFRLQEGDDKHSSCVYTIEEIDL
jgi:hypothetical protein